MRTGFKVPLDFGLPPKYKVLKVTPLSDTPPLNFDSFRIPPLHTRPQDKERPEDNTSQNPSAGRRRPRAPRPIAPRFALLAVYHQ